MSDLQLKSFYIVRACESAIGQAYANVRVTMLV